MIPFELDHILICTDAGAPAGEQLQAAGLTEGTSNVHPGQGTQNRRFFFHNAMLELLWVHNPEEAQSAITRPTQLWERWSGRHGDATPFAICLRPKQPETTELPFEAWAYTPSYVPTPLVVHIGDNSDRLTEPMLFYMAFGRRPDQATAPEPLEHAAGLREITSLRIQYPQTMPLSETLRAVVEMGIVSVSDGTSVLMEIGFDGETRGQSIDLRPELPLVLCW